MRRFIALCLSVLLPLQVAAGSLVVCSKHQMQGQQSHTPAASETHSHVHSADRKDHQTSLEAEHHHAGAHMPDKDKPAGFCQSCIGCGGCAMVVSTIPMPEIGPHQVFWMPGPAGVLFGISGAVDPPPPKRI